VGTDLEYEEEPPPQNEIFYTEASPQLRAARIAVRLRTQTHPLSSALQSTMLCFALNVPHGMMSQGMIACGLHGL
jgi:hypothetical protein